MSLSIEVNAFAPMYLILEYFSNISFSHFVRIYFFNVYIFLFNCFAFVILQRNCSISYLECFTFYSMVDKCIMNQLQRFQFFGNKQVMWKNTLFISYQSGKITLEVSVLMIEYLVATSYEF